MKTSRNILSFSGKPWVIHPAGQQPVNYTYDPVGNVTQVTVYTPGKGIAIDVQGAKDFADKIKMNPLYFASLAVVHGAGHNAGFNHSTQDPYSVAPSRYGQNKNNCAIMCSGWTVENNGTKIDYMDKSLNSLYIERMKQVFGVNKSSVNYKK